MTKALNSLVIVVGLLVVCASGASLAEEALRTPQHQQYASELWKFVTESQDYSKWAVADSPAQFDFGPSIGATSISYLNSAAQTDPSFPIGACVVTQHRDDAGEVTGVTVNFRARPDYDRRTGDWYWAHYLPDGTVVKTSADKNPHDKRDFVTRVDDGRLWVFRIGSPDLAQFLTTGEPAKIAIRVGAGPNGMTVKGTDGETIDSYLLAADGFVTFVDDGRLWIFKAGSEDLKSYQEDGEPAKIVIRVGAGPNGMTVKGPEAETIDAYLSAIGN
ncbi:MAG: hypothetical protein KDA71_03435 [Planctomycetales bacterium]|nr:hypothetical protein [Planctomycetales bacterium]